jgi:hypothetical protein
MHLHPHSQTQTASQAPPPIPAQLTFPPTQTVSQQQIPALIAHLRIQPHPLLPPLPRTRATLLRDLAWTRMARFQTLHRAGLAACRRRMRPLPQSLGLGHRG